MTRRTHFLVALLLGTGLLGSCALPDDAEPRVITAADAPLDLSQVPGAESAETPEGDDQVGLYFVRDGFLRRVMRASPDGQLSTAIDLLFAGPTANETSISTSIPGDTQLNSAVIDGTTAVIDLGCSGDVAVDPCGVLAVVGQGQFTLFAQLACTATDVAGVDGVRFLQEGEPQDVPTDSGTVQSPGLVTCDDYQSLAS